MTPIPYLIFFLATTETSVSSAHIYNWTYMATVEVKIKAENIIMLNLSQWSMKYIWDLWLDKADSFLSKLMVTGQMRPDWDQKQKGQVFQQFSIKGPITTIGKTCKILMQNTNLRFSFQVQIGDNLLKETMNQL